MGKLFLIIFKRGIREKMVKKSIFLLTLFALLLLLSGYGLSSGVVLEQNNNDITVKTGLAVISVIDNSKDAQEEEGLAQTDSVIVAVMVGENDKIIKSAIDEVQTKINFSSQGEISTPLDEVFGGKQESGEDYGMIKASSIGKEWYQQADAFSDYVAGKTVKEIKGIAVNEEGVPANSELVSSVTIHIGDFITGIEKAVFQAKQLGATADNKLGIGVISTIGFSEDATSPEGGFAQAYSTYAAVTVNKEGVITSSIIDASQSDVRFNQKGEIISDLSIIPKTKNEWGDEYGMKSASSIGKEWYQQADAFSKYVVGKTMDEVKGISLNEEGVPANSELTSSVTIHVGDFITVIERAYDSAN